MPKRQLQPECPCVLSPVFRSGHTLERVRCRVSVIVRLRNLKSRRESSVSLSYSRFVGGASLCSMQKLTFTSWRHSKCQHLPISLTGPTNHASNVYLSSSSCCSSVFHRRGVLGLHHDCSALFTLIVPIMPTILTAAHIQAASATERVE